MQAANLQSTLSAGVVITAVDAFLFLMLERVGIRNLEALFGVLIGVMAASFGYMYVDAGVDIADVGAGLLVSLHGRHKSSPLIHHEPPFPQLMFDFLLPTGCYSNAPALLPTPVNF